jgi:hypothetical protein
MEMSSKIKSNYADAEQHYFNATPALCKNFDAAPDHAVSTPTLLYSNPTFFKQTTVLLGVGFFF